MIEWTYFFLQLYSKHSGLVMFKLHLKISNRYLKRGHGGGQMKITQDILFWHIFGHHFELCVDITYVL